MFVITSLGPEESQRLKEELLVLVWRTPRLVTVAEDTPEDTPATKQARARATRLSGCFGVGSDRTVVLGHFWRRTGPRVWRYAANGTDLPADTDIWTNYIIFGLSYRFGAPPSAAYPPPPPRS